LTRPERPRNNGHISRKRRICGVSHPGADVIGVERASVGENVSELARPHPDFVPLDDRVARGDIRAEVDRSAAKGFGQLAGSARAIDGEIDPVRGDVGASVKLREGDLQAV